MDYSRHLCDKLLGTDRNEHPNKATGGVRFWDADVCKKFLVGFCPFHVFTNTKSDIGFCPKKLHEDYLIRDYETNAKPEIREEYEMELYRHLDQLISDVDKKGKKGHARLEFKSTDDVMQMLNPNKDENDERIVEMESRVKGMLQKIEEYGEQGRIKEAQDLTAEVDKINLEIERLKSIEDANPLFKLEKRMAVCEVCGCLLVMNEDPKRTEMHLGGKQHIGYIKVRELYDTFKSRYGDLSGYGRGRDSYGGSRKFDNFRQGDRRAGGRRDERRDYHERRDFHDRRDSNDKRDNERREERRDDKRDERRDERRDDKRDERRDDKRDERRRERGEKTDDHRDRHREERRRDERRRSRSPR